MSGESTPLQIIDDLDVAPQQDKTRVIKDLLAGTAGGISQVLVGQPFDTTKVRLQTSTTPTSAIDVVKNLLKNEGPSGFYKGTLTPLIGVGACVSIQFGVNEAMKRYFHSVNNLNSETLSLSQYYLSGLAGGVANSFLASPIEHVRIRLQTQTSSGANADFKGPLDCIRKLRAQGGLMRGLSATMLRESHGCGTYFLVYEALVANEVNKLKVKRADIPAWKLCLFGAFSGTTLWMMVYPLDVIKSVIQTDNIKNPKNGNSIRDVAKRIYGRGGLSAFFKGFGPTMLRAAPANGATFATFELFMRLMN
ncbi:hypothetical protein TPHA_0M01550 [Tetrapisispora phaffii CBS 4417]|uniref:Carrier protein YMC1, mitochondrial n=1 Tax=Tetrapisispora phaffii (strain ATCC 24235 / CBS 4417 / NBRC 1672 / NRRL Y-8282 / UCD 70-5) TaxID=1071381 RepID=G8C0L5_TETPH|nr:hypothetical protein TPHA_0M01550 [Tetrapisispora phaffii CBS 4417]CCE65730.1 hypothetical protein TPHA_0M01550 [Tetrapisispora phaffii CBS 4417]